MTRGDEGEGGWTQVGGGGAASSSAKRQTANPHQTTKNDPRQATQKQQQQQQQVRVLSKGGKSNNGPQQQQKWGPRSNTNQNASSKPHSQNRPNNNNTIQQNNSKKNQQNNSSNQQKKSSAPNAVGKKKKPGNPVQLGDLAPQLKSQQSATANKRKPQPHNNNRPKQPVPGNGQRQPPAPPQQVVAPQQMAPKPNAWNLSNDNFPVLSTSGNIEANASENGAGAWQTTKAATPSRDKPQQQQQSPLAKKAPVAKKTKMAPAPAKNTKKAPTTASDNKKGPPPAANKKKPEPSVSIADMFAPKARTSETDTTRGGGDELQLLRLMQEGKVASANKGRGHRQRIGPRKKRFSTLKKNVLKERLRKWQEQNGLLEGEEADADTSSTTVVVFGFAEPELLEDDDEYEELVHNLHELAKAVTPEIRNVYIPQTLDQEPKQGYPAFVQFQQPQDVDKAVSCWNDLSLGGQKLQVFRMKIPTSLDDEGAGEGGADSQQALWKDRCLEQVMSVGGESPSSQNKEVVLEDVLTEDDLEDEECLEESLQDIRTMVEKHGSVAEMQVLPGTKSVLVIYHDADAAKLATKNLSNTVLGGSTVVARLQKSVDTETCSLLLKNALSEEDVEDEDCLEESLGDLRELAGRYGKVVSVVLEEGGSVKIVLTGSTSVARTAATGFKSMVIGGEAIEAVVVGDSPNADAEGDENKIPGGEKNEEVASTESKQMFSGDKIIGESWAEMKRAPKIPNKPNPRKYATLIEDETAKPLLVEMLGELMRLQKRAVEEGKNTNTKRRLVMGLREVARGIRTQKVRMVVMANNLDEYGAIDEKLQEILDLAQEQDVPVFFEFSKRTLGKAIGKTIKIAVVGVQNLDGAHQQFKKLMKLYQTSST